MEFVRECYNTQEICDKALNKCFIAVFAIPDQYKIQDMCDRIISEENFSIRYVSDLYKNQKNVW